MDNQTIGLRVRGIDMPVHDGPGHIVDGIAFGHLDDEVFVTITRDGRAFTVRMRGETIDRVAGLFAEAIHAATAAEQPSLETMQ